MLMAGKRTFVIALLSASLAMSLMGCKSSHQANDTAASSSRPESSETSNSLSADISGAYSGHFTATGDEVSIGFLGNVKAGTARFTIGARNDESGKSTDLSTGMVAPFTLATNTEVEALSPRFSLTVGDTETKYNGPAYLIYFATQPDQAVGHITLTTVEKIPSAHPSLVRYHLAGTFHFLAANPPEPQSKACTEEAGMYAGTRGKRYPPYKADLCGAKSISVKGKFNVIQDFLADSFQ